MSIYDFTFIDNNGNTVEMSQFKDKTLLLVNTASQCGFTPQYEGLQALHNKYKDKGLVVIGFPCNQFGEQEPGNDADIKDFCTKNYGVDFLMSSKIDVVGENAHPLFKYLLEKSDFEEIPWNFTKFLIDDDFRSMGSQFTPEKIDAVLAEKIK